MKTKFNALVTLVQDTERLSNENCKILNAQEEVFDSDNN